MSDAPKDVNIKELPVPVSEPAPLGLIGLAVAALVLASTDLGFASHTAKALMIPWAIFLGATAQLIAGIMDYKRNNIFGATAFTTYSLLWYSVGMTLWITIFYDVEVDLTHYATGLLGFLIFSLILTIASTLTNKVLLSILVFIDGAIFTLYGHYIWGWGPEPVGFFLVLVSMMSFYGAMGALFNTMTGRPVIPMGAPVGFPLFNEKKDEAEGTEPGSDDE